MGVAAVHTGHHSLVTIALESGSQCVHCSIGARARQGTLELCLEIALASQHIVHGARHRSRAALEGSSRGIQRIQAAVHEGKGAQRGDCLNTTCGAANGALGSDLEDAQLGGIRGMKTATKLCREGLRALTCTHDAHFLAVLLAKEGHRARSLGVLQAHELGGHRQRQEDLLVDQVFYLGDLGLRKSLEVSKVKAQAIGGYQRACLMHVVAQHLLKSSVQQVGGSVVATDKLAAAIVHLGGDDVAHTHEAALDGAFVGNEAVMGDGVLYLHAKLDARELAGIADLAAHLGIEGGAIKHDLHLVAGLGTQDALAVAHNGQHGAAAKLALLIAAKLGGIHRVRERRPYVNLAPGVRIGGAGGASTGALGLHVGVKSSLIDVVAGIEGDLAGEVYRESVGVVKGESHMARESLSLAQFVQLLLQIEATGLDDRGETGFLCAHGALDQGGVVHQLRIDIAHKACDLGHIVTEERLLDAQQAAVEHGAAQQAAQHIAATLVGRQDAVANHEAHGAAVICNDAQRDICGRVFAVLLARKPLSYLDEGVHKIAVIIGRLMLHDSRHAL